MVKRVSVSRQGLTRCPSCGSHVKIAASLQETICPFCNTSLQDAVAEGPLQGAIRRAADSLTRGRSHLIAASLLGASALVGCPSDEGDTGAADSAMVKRW